MLRFKMPGPRRENHRSLCMQQCKSEKHVGTKNYTKVWRYCQVLCLSHGLVPVLVVWSADALNYYIPNLTFAFSRICIHFPDKNLLSFPSKIVNLVYSKEKNQHNDQQKFWVSMKKGTSISKRKFGDRLKEDSILASRNFLIWKMLLLCICCTA